MLQDAVGVVVHRLVLQSNAIPATIGSGTTEDLGLRAGIACCSTRLRTRKKDRSAPHGNKFIWRTNKAQARATLESLWPATGVPRPVALPRFVLRRSRRLKARRIRDAEKSENNANLRLHISESDIV